MTFGIIVLPAIILSRKELLTDVAKEEWLLVLPHMHFKFSLPGKGSHTSFPTTKK